MHSHTFKDIDVMFRFFSSRSCLVCLSKVFRILCLIQASKKKNFFYWIMKKIYNESETFTESINTY